MSQTASVTVPNIADNPNAPYSQQAEEAVVGSILINPSHFITVAAFLNPDDFFLLRHNYIWQAFARLSERNEAIDTLTVGEELANMKLLDDIGGRAYLLSLINSTPTAVYAEVYGRIVERTSIRRRMLEAADKVRELAVDEAINIETALSEAENAVFNISAAQSVQREFTPLLQIMSDEYDRMQEALERTAPTPGVPTGFTGVDAITGGLHKGDLLVFAGRPGSGKSSLLTSLGLNASRTGARVGIFTMEMGTKQYGQRLVAQQAGIPIRNIIDGKLSDDERSRYVEAVGRLSKLPIFIDDSASLNPIQMVRKVRRLKHEYGLDVLMLDYIQLMNGGSDFKNNRVQEVGYITRQLKELARDMDVPLLAAAQLSRAVEQRQNKRPQLSDLRESGSIENDADLVGFLYRDEVYNPDTTEYPNQADIIIAKHRNGATGTVSLFFNKQLTRFENASVHSVDLSDLR